MPLVTTMYSNMLSKFSEEEKQQCEEGRRLYGQRRLYTNMATIKPPCSNKIPKHMCYPALVGYMFSYTYDPEERIMPCK